ncbi:MAG: sigma-70 family RNA polymerase sigma factor [Planctomycetota bacterium]|nr:MAG: sigma-70 family RNA polymerase sigma factor [Planctomycetota bacterium]
MTRSNRPLFTDDAGRRDSKLVESALAGDQKAFERLVEAYERPAVATAYRLLGNTHDAMEVVQEALLRAYRSLDRLKEPSRFGPWLMRIVSNLSLNARRSRRSGTTVTLDEQLGTEGMVTSNGRPVTTSVGPSQQIEGRELQEAIDTILDSMPEKQRLSLVLFAIEGWAQKDIADVLECSVENVKWNVFQARKKLREQLGDILLD